MIGAEAIEQEAGALLDGEIAPDSTGDWVIATVESGDWEASARKLQQSMGMNLLECLTAVDHLGREGVGEKTLELVVHLYNVDAGKKIALKTWLAREDARVATLAGLYPGADWFEREAAELFGITFEGHPNPEHLILPDDWEGFPMRKDYADPEDSY